MLSEEEKKAIEMIEIIVDECKLENKRKGYEGTYYDGDTPIPYKEYETVLNLITKLQKENEEKDKQIDLILKEQIEDGYLVNFHNLEEAREYYRKLVKEKVDKQSIKR